MRAWLTGLIGLLTPLLCAGLWSWGTYHLAVRGYTGPVQRPSERDHQAVLCKAWLVQERHNSRVWAMQLHLSCSNPLISWFSLREISTTRNIIWRNYINWKYILMILNDIFCIGVISILFLPSNGAMEIIHPMDWTPQFKNTMGYNVCENAKMLLRMK